LTVTDLTWDAEMSLECFPSKMRPENVDTNITQIVWKRDAQIKAHD